MSEKAYDLSAIRSSRKTRAYIDDETREGIVRAWHQGKTKTEIAIMFDVSESSAVRIGRESGIDIPQTRRHWTQKEVGRLERLMERGVCVADIAKELGRTQGSVSGYISEHYEKVKRVRHPKRLDGTPDLTVIAPPEPVANNEPLELENARNSEDAVVIDKTKPKDFPIPPEFEVEERHTKTVHGKYGTYIFNVNNDGRFDADLFPTMLRDLSPEEFRSFGEEIVRVSELL